MRGINLAHLRGRWRCLLAAFLIGICGCGAEDTRAKVVPVTGQVLYKGEPVAGASVAFWGDGTATPAVGQTDSSGKFKLTTQDREGAVLGKHKVTVSKIEVKGGATGNPSMEDAAKAPAVVTEAKSELPKKYSEQAQSPLEQTVTASGPNDFKLELKDE